MKFFRQHPLIYEEDRGRIHFFIADFYTAEEKLVLEIDGKIHDKQKDYNRERDLIIERLGLKVVRFRNEETEGIGALLVKVASFFLNIELPSPHVFDLIPVPSLQAKRGTPELAQLSK